MAWRNRGWGEGVVTRKRLWRRERAMWRDGEKDYENRERGRKTVGEMHGSGGRGDRVN